MKKFGLFRNIIEVFHLYGIRLVGKRKYDNLYLDLHMDQVFVLGLIYELELVADNELNDDDAYVVQAPVQIIAKLLNRN